MSGLLSLSSESCVENLIFIPVKKHLEIVGLIRFLVGLRARPGGPVKPVKPLTYKSLYFYSNIAFLVPCSFLGTWLPNIKLIWS